MIRARGRELGKDLPLPNRLGLLFVALAVLGGCGFPLAAPVRVGANRVARPAIPSERFDGSYQGHTALLAASGPGCPLDPHKGVIEIGDAVLIYPYTPELILTAPVRPDGSVHAVAGPAVLDGRIVNNRLSFTIRTPTCLSRYSTHFVWNHS
jgi:hypothetical protein